MYLRLTIEFGEIMVTVKHTVNTLTPLSVDLSRSWTPSSFPTLMSPPQVSFIVV